MPRTPKTERWDIIEGRQDRLLDTLDVTHAKYCQRKETNWPSLHFHLGSLKAAEDRDLERFVEYAYAMLVSWQMNYGRARMREFDEFRSSLQLVWSVPHSNSSGRRCGSFGRRHRTVSMEPTGTT